MSDNPLRPLGDEQVEGAAGGYLYYAGAENGFGNQWQIIDGKGNVVCTHTSLEDAMDCAYVNSFSNKEITKEELQRLRETGSIN